MKQIKFSLRPAFLLPAVALLILLVADLVQVTRASGLSAATCIPVLFRETPDVQGLVVRYRDTIAREAALYDLPAEMVAAVIVNHQAYISSFRRFTDCFGSAWGADLSLGLAQVRLSTAARIDGSPLEGFSASEYRDLRTRLLDAEQNILYEARELRALIEQENRFPGMSAQMLIHDPFVMALLITEYRMGRLDTPSDSSRLSVNAFGALQRIHDGTMDRFDRDPNDTLRIQSEIREYLHYINCESGIFNLSACERWGSH